MIKPTNTISPTTIKKWAYRKKHQELPLQLEELRIVVEHGDLLLSLASDQQCPQRAYVLGCLYSLVGKSVSKHINSDIGLVNILLGKAASFQDTVILNLVARSRIILQDLRKYDYVEWCEGGFVRKDLSGIVIQRTHV